MFGTVPITTNYHPANVITSNITQLTKWSAPSQHVGHNFIF